MELIGKGMIAMAFQSAGIGCDDLLVFCSGVSNSNEISVVQFERERSLLNKVIRSNQNKKIVYFSSCAAESTDMPYYRHKLEMERMLKTTASRYLIARLPQVVGITNNHTLISHFVKCIKDQLPITLLQGARRNLIDVDDVVRLTILMTRTDANIINITNGKMIDVKEMIDIISCQLGMEPILLPGPVEIKSTNYDGSLLAKLIGSQDPIYSCGYNSSILSKYVPELEKIK